MKKVFMPLLVLVTVLAVIAGILAHMGIKNISDITNLEDFDYSFTYTNDGKDSKLSFSRDIVGDIKTLEVDIALIDVIIKEGDQFNVAYEGKTKYKPDVTTTGNKLVVSQKGKFGNASVGINKETGTLTITIPEGTVFDSASIEAAMSKYNIDVLNAKELTFEVAMGEMDVNKAAGDILKVGTQSGDVDIDCDYTDINVECAMGNIDITLAKDVDDYDVTTEAAMGSVKVGEHDAKGLSASSSGSGKSGSIRVDCSMGNVDIHN